MGLKGQLTPGACGGNPRAAAKNRCICGSAVAGRFATWRFAVWI